jgi:hypothetical protein
MRMTRWPTLALALAVALPATHAADPAALTDGHWRLSQHLGATAQSPMALLKVEKKDDKLAATVVDTPIKAGLKVTELKLDGKAVKFNLEIGTGKYAFEGTFDAKDSKLILGSFGDGTRLFRASLAAQDSDKIERPALPKAPDQIIEAQRLTRTVAQLQLKARQSKDANDKADLLAKAKDAQKEADEKVPALYREVIAKNADSPFAIDAANSLLRQAGKIKPKADEVAAWIKVVESDANRYGPKVALDAALQVGEILIGQKEIAATALPLAERVEKGLKDTDPLAMQSRALKLLASAEKAAGRTNAATESRLQRVETALDEDYIKKVPPFKPEKFAGRRDKSATRAVVMELFTGATCPPCVAADAAFDGLEKAYGSTDLILIQYHMHIPGPDPMTNPDTIARWDYYRDKFPEAIRGVPSSVFNGKPQAGGGGGMPNALSKYNQYKGIIDPLLEEKSDIKLSGTARRAGDKVTMDVGVEGVKSGNDKVKLRVLLVEEKVKYVGSNGMRFHHQVVRAMPGGAAGIALGDQPLKKSLDVNLAELRKGLTKYLDDFAAERPFANPDRPLDLSHLKVIAFVQDDATGEILNGAQFDVVGK